MRMKWKEVRYLFPGHAGMRAVGRSVKSVRLFREWANYQMALAKEGKKGFASDSRHSFWAIHNDPSDWSSYGLCRIWTKKTERVNGNENGNGKWHDTRLKERINFPL